MGIIYNDKVAETKVYEAYGLTVYGKVNRYVWTIYGTEEDALITIRIADAEGKDIFSRYMGNNCILQSRIDDTIDNFLWWIIEDQPDTSTIEKQVLNSLCSSNCFFNHTIENRKFKKMQEEKERKRIEEREKEKRAAINSIKAYCDKNGFISYFTYDGAYVIKTHTENALQALKTADNKRMESLIEFMKKYPDNKDARLIKSGTIEEVSDYVNGGK